MGTALEANDENGEAGKGPTLIFLIVTEDAQPITMNNQYSISDFMSVSDIGLQRHFMSLSDI